MRLIGLAFILTLSFTLAPLAPGAQQAGPAHRIGVLLHDGAPPGLLESFRGELYKLGYVEGKNITIELRNAAGKNERLSGLVDDLLRLKVDVILAVNTPAAQAAKKATATVPIVITRIGDPVRAGLVPSLAKPAGNLTGVSVNSPDLGPKRVQLLREAIPNISRVAILFNADNPGTTDNVQAMESAGSQLGLQVLRFSVRAPGDVSGAFQAAKRARAQALLVVDDTAITNYRGEILKLAASHSMPVGSVYKGFAEAGGLIAYGPNLPALYRQTTDYVNKILKGSRPSDLPIEEPRQYDLVINLQTAKALGLTIPQSVLLRADQVIQ